MRCVPIDLAVRRRRRACPADADYVVNFAVAKSNEWEKDLRANSGGLAYLMEHHREARAFLHCSTTGIYKPMGHHVFAEGDPLGDNHGVWPFLRTYSICKIAAEATALWAADRFGLPTTIARLSVPYGDRGGWPAIHLEMMLNGSDIPVHVDAPSVYHPIHEDDIVAMVPGLLGCGRHPGHRRQLGRQPGGQHRGVVRLPGRADRAHADASPPPPRPSTACEIDLTRMHELVGPPPSPGRTGCAAWSPPATPSCSAAEPAAPVGPGRRRSGPEPAQAGSVPRPSRHVSCGAGAGHHQPLALR